MPEPTSSSLGLAYLMNEAHGSSRAAMSAAALIGGIVSLRFVDNMNTKQRILSVVIGVWLADMFAHPIAESLGAPQYTEGCAAMVGLFGISIIGAIFKTIKRIDIASIIGGYFGGGK